MARLPSFVMAHLKARPGAVPTLMLGLVLVGAVARAAEPAALVRPYLWQPGMAASSVGEVNVFRRFPSERTEAVTEFYRDVLALPMLPASALGGGRMIRYPVGASEVKLFPVEAEVGQSVPVDAAAGVRVLTFFYADEAALVARFAAHAFETPGFRSDTSRAGATRAALVRDPAGQWVELVIVPGATAATLGRFEIGIVATNLDATRAFYRDFIGFDEAPSVRDETLGARRYTETFGTTTINLWSFGPGLPKDSATAGMQYIVWNAAAVSGVAEERGASISRPLSKPGQMRTVWLEDPDGVSNYFAEFAGNDNRPPTPQN